MREPVVALDLDAVRVSLPGLECRARAAQRRADARLPDERAELRALVDRRVVVDRAVGGTREDLDVAVGRSRPRVPDASCPARPAGAARRPGRWPRRACTGWPSAFAVPSEAALAKSSLAGAAASAGAVVRQPAARARPAMRVRLARHGIVMPPASSSRGRRGNGAGRRPFGGKPTGGGLPRGAQGRITRLMDRRSIRPARCTARLERRSSARSSVTASPTPSGPSSAVARIRPAQPLDDRSVTLRCDRALSVDG